MRPPPTVISQRSPALCGVALDHRAEHLEALAKGRAELLLHLGLGVEGDRRDLGDGPRRCGGRVELGAAPRHEDVPQLLVRLDPRHDVCLAPARERQQALVARESPAARALAVVHHPVGAQQDRPQRRRVGELGEVASAARNEVVQEQRVAVAGAVAEHRVDDDLEREVVGSPADVLAQSELDRGGERRQREHAPQRGHGWQRQQQPLRLERAAERDRARVLLGRGAQRAPRAVLVLRVARGLAVELPAFGADPEQLGGDLGSRDQPRRSEAAGTTEVQPPQLEVLHVLGAEAEVPDVPLARDVGRFEVRDDDLLEALADAVVARVVDRGLVAAHRR